MAALVEVGVLGTTGFALLLLLVVRVPRPSTDTEVLNCTLLSLAPVVATDAFLQLPATSLWFCTVIGLLTPFSAGAPAPSTALRRAFLVIGLLVVLEATLRNAGVARASSHLSLEWQARIGRWIPMDERGNFEVAEALVLSGRCEEARPLFAQLRSALGNYQQVQQLIAMCSP